MRTTPTSGQLVPDRTEYVNLPTVCSEAATNCFQSLFFSSSFLSRQATEHLSCPYVSDMSDEESAPSFLEDVRVKFVADKVCELLQLQSETLERSAAGEDFQQLLRVFFEGETVLFFSSSKKHSLTASHEVRSP